MAIELSRWDTVEMLDNHEVIIEYLSQAIEEDNPADPGNHASLLDSVKIAVGALRRLQGQATDQQDAASVPAQSETESAGASKEPPMMTHAELMAANLNEKVVAAALDQAEKRLADTLENKNALDEKISQLFSAYLTVAVALFGVSGFIGVETTKWPFFAGGFVLFVGAIPLILALWSRTYGAAGSPPDVWLKPGTINNADDGTVTKVYAVIVRFMDKRIRVSEAANITKARLFQTAIIIGVVAPFIMGIAAAFINKP